MLLGVAWPASRARAQDPIVIQVVQFSPDDPDVNPNLARSAIVQALEAGLPGRRVVLAPVVDIQNRQGAVARLRPPAVAVLWGFQFHVSDSEYQLHRAQIFVGGAGALNRLNTRTDTFTELHGVIMRNDNAHADMGLYPYIVAYAQLLRVRDVARARPLATALLERVKHIRVGVAVPGGSRCLGALRAAINQIATGEVPPGNADNTLRC